MGRRLPLTAHTLAAPRPAVVGITAETALRSGDSAVGWRWLLLAPTARLPLQNQQHKFVWRRRESSSVDGAGRGEGPPLPSLPTGGNSFGE